MGHPALGTYISSNAITLTAPLTAGTGPFTYHWKKGAANVSNGGTISGAATDTLSISSAALTDAGSYSLAVTNFAGATTSAPVVITINQGVAITSQPSSITVDVPGHTAKFTVVATGNPLAYQWYFNSNAIAGATSASYTNTSVSSADIGYYYVVVGNTNNTVKSSVVTLKIGQFFFFDALTNSTSAANWNVFTNKSDSTTNWAFDYTLHDDNSGPGIPQNTNSTSPTALQLTINSSGTNNGASITLVPKTINATGDYQFSFDVFMNFLGGAGTPGSQTAQSMTAALGCVANITNGISGFSNGVVAFANCDNALSADDYAMYANSSAGSGSAKVSLSDLVAGSGYHINSYYAFVSASNTVTFPTNEVLSTLDGAASQSRPLPYDVGTFGLAWHHVLIQRSGTGTGTTTVTYYIDGKPIGTVTNAFFGNSGNAIDIGLWATFAGGGSTNWEFTLFNNVKVESFPGAGVAPTITTPVADLTANAGSAAILSVTAGTSPTTLRYQWAKGGVNLSNGGNISGATSSALTISGVLATNAGSYSVTVLNDSDFVSGGSGILTVIDPAITAQPTNTTVECSSDAVLSVTAAGTGTLTYQWFTPDANGTAVPSATASSLTINNANGSSSYAVVVTGSAGTATSSVATVSTVDTTAPVITMNAGVSTICLGHIYTDPGASATDACEGSVGTSTSGTVNTSIAGDYTLTYSAQDSSSNPSTATRVVQVVTCGAGITLQPLGTNINAGKTLTLTIAASGLNPTYQWSSNSIAILDATNATYTKLNVTQADAATYTCAATADSTTIVSDPAVVTVNDPAVNVQPVNVVATTKSNITFSITAAGTGPLTYQWYFIKNGTTTPKKMVKSATIPAVTNATLSINNVAGAANGGSYYCMVTNSLHSGTVSSNATLTVYDAPLVKIAPPSKTLLAGFNYTMVAKVTKGALNQTLSYQWNKNGNAIGGATTSTYSLVDVQTPDTAVYSCVVSNNSPTGGSASLSLTVTQDTEVPKVVLLLKPTDMAAKHALTTNDVPVDPTGTNHAPDVDFLGKAVDKGLIVSAWVSNAVNQAVFPATFVKKVTDLTATNTAAGKPAFFLSHVSMVDGTNIFWGLATDSDGNTSTTTKGTHMFFIANPQALTLATSGTGRITSVTDATSKNWGNPTNTAVLAVGHNYTIKATPIGHLVTFQKWTVSDSTGPLADQLANPLTFTMTPGRTNTAVFSNHP